MAADIPPRRRGPIRVSRPASGPAPRGASGSGRTLSRLRSARSMSTGRARPCGGSRRRRPRRRTRGDDVPPDVVAVVLRPRPTPGRPGRTTARSSRPGPPGTGLRRLASPSGRPRVGRRRRPSAGVASYFALASQTRVLADRGSGMWTRTTPTPVACAGLRHWTWVNRPPRWAGITSHARGMAATSTPGRSAGPGPGPRSRSAPSGPPAGGSSSSATAGSRRRAEQPHVHPCPRTARSASERSCADHGLSPVRRFKAAASKSDREIGAWATHHTARSGGSRGCGIRDRPPDLRAAVGPQTSERPRASSWGPRGSTLPPTRWRPYAIRCRRAVRARGRLRQPDPGRLPGLLGQLQLGRVHRLGPQRAGVHDPPADAVGRRGCRGPCTARPRPTKRMPGSLASSWRASTVASPSPVRISPEHAPQGQARPDRERQLERDHAVRRRLARADPDLVAVVSDTLGGSGTPADGGTTAACRSGSTVAGRQPGRDRPGGRHERRPRRGARAPGGQGRRWRCQSHRPPASYPPGPAATRKTPDAAGGSGAGGSTRSDDRPYLAAAARPGHGPVFWKL